MGRAKRAKERSFVRSFSHNQLTLRFCVLLLLLLLFVFFLLFELVLITQHLIGKIFKHQLRDNLSNGSSRTKKNIKHIHNIKRKKIYHIELSKKKKKTMMTIHKNDAHIATGLCN